MTGMQIGGIACLVYTALTFYIALAKPPKIWQIAKIQAFVKSLGEKGTVIFFMGWGSVVAVIGVYLLTAG